VQQIFTKSRISIYPLVGFGVFIVIFIASWLVTSKHVNDQMSVNLFTHEAADKMHTISNLIEIARKRTRLSSQMLISDDVFEKDEISNEIRGLAGDFIRHRERLLTQHLSEEEYELLESQVPLYREAIQNLEMVASLAIEDTPEATEKARNIIFREIVPLQATIIDGFTHMMRSIEEQVHNTSQSLEERNKKYQNIQFVLLLIILFLSVATIYIVIRNITRIENKMIELSYDLQIEKEVAEQADLSKSHFLAAASHDLRQPLHALSFLFDALKTSQSAEERNALLPKIDLSITALGNLFNELLDISKLDAGTVEPHLEHFHLYDILHASLEEFSTEAKDKGLTLRVHCGEHVVYSDQTLLERITRNLIVNAIRYTNSGGVLISCRTRKNYILFQVWDTGIGIDDDLQEKVFKEFFQADNPHRDREKGIGLGLSIVKRMSDLLGHELHLRSIKDKGTVISILIPMGDIDHCLLEDDSETVDPWSLEGLDVLLIDDDVGVLEATEIMLDKWGCNVIKAMSAQGALNVLQDADNTPGLILSDLRLPDNTNGIDTIDAIRTQLAEQIPAILITGDTEPGRISIARNSGLKVMHKPLKPAKVRAAIHQLLS